jgi:hypothetical protein
VFSLFDALFLSIYLPGGYSRHIPVQMWLDSQFPYSFSLIAVWFPCIGHKLKQLNRVSSHIPASLVVPSSHYAMNICSVNTMVCSIVHMMHCCRSDSMSTYVRSQPCRVYFWTILPMANAPPTISPVNHRICNICFDTSFHPLPFEHSVCASFP